MQNYAEAVAMKIVANVFNDAGRSWRQAANQNSKGTLLYKAIMQEMQTPTGGVFHHLVQQNANYIASVPFAIAEEFTDHIATKAMQGLRSEEIAKDLIALYPHVSDVKARLIARTEVAKAHTAFSQARDASLGVQWYEWNTSEDGRVRRSHQEMDKTLVRWSDPPSPEALVGEKSVGHYHAGNIYNCRCAPLGLLDLDEVNWPCKVYYDGEVVMMTRTQFKQIWTPSPYA